MVQDTQTRYKLACPVVMVVVLVLVVVANIPFPYHYIIKPGERYQIGAPMISMSR
jgi:PDZ domain-containing secreted protein